MTPLFDLGIVAAAQPDPEKPFRWYLDLAGRFDELTYESRHGQWVYSDDSQCPACQQGRHEDCEGRTQPDCDLVGDSYQQTNRCDCPECDAYERRWREVHGPYGTPDESEWPLHVLHVDAVER